MSGTWRRKVHPGCPGCGAPPMNAYHWDCPAFLPPQRRLLALLWIALETGTVRCDGCKESWPFEITMHHCRCGLVFTGGEIWEGMAAEIGNLGNHSWVRAAGIKRGAAHTTAKGWWFCLACQQNFRKETGLLRSGSDKGGLCETCRAQALRRFRWRIALAIWGGAGVCSWCGQRRDGDRIVTIGKARLCKLCALAMQDGLRAGYGGRLPWSKA